MIPVQKLIPGGQALGTHPDGRKIFFWNALPGETVVDYEVTQRKSRYYEAIATKIAHPSPQRVVPEDECYLATSPWQILAYPYELAQKRALVQEIFREHQIAIEPPEIVTDGSQYHYRNKMEYALYWDRDTEKIHLAFHARGSHRKLSIDQSSLEQPAIFARAQAIVENLNRKHAEARQFQSLLLRANRQGQISGGLYEKNRPHPAFAPLADTILGHQYRYSPNGFFQINLPVYELALREIQAHLETSKVLDLYAGVGTIGLSVARDRNLTLVEADRFAFAELVQNLPRGDGTAAASSDRAEPTAGTDVGISASAAVPIAAANDAAATVAKTVAAPAPVKSVTSATAQTPTSAIQAYLAKSEQVLDFITSDTTVILDPPRAGCAPALVERLVSVAPPKIIYLSCNPATQARDLEQLLSVYRLETVKTYNFFPRTPHIENLVVLSRK